PPGRSAARILPGRGMNSGLCTLQGHGGPAAYQCRDHLPCHQNSRGEPTMGRPPNPWRTVEAGNRRGGAHGLQADPEAANTAVADLAQFLTNHVRDLVAIDFFTVPTAHWRVLFVLVVLAHHRRRILHFNVTEHPTAEWTAQQVVDAFPDDSVPSYLLRDRDTVYGDAVRQRVKGMGIAEILTAPHSPWQNPFAERLIGSIRRECLDHVLVLSEPHLRRTLTRYFAYYHGARTHLSLDKDAPDGRPVARRNSAQSSRFPKSAACIIATSAGRRSPVPPERPRRPPTRAPGPTHVTDPTLPSDRPPSSTLPSAVSASCGPVSPSPHGP